MDNCRECHFELPMKVRFCPGCGMENPLASATKSGSAPPVELSLAEPALDTPAPASAPPVSVPVAKPARVSNLQPPRQDLSLIKPPPPPATQAKSSAYAAGSGTSPAPDRKPVRIGRWLVVAVVALAVVGWFARPLFGPPDPCQSAGVSSELDQARTALSARDHRTALSKSTLTLTTCAQGQRADELRRIQTEAVNFIVAEGRRCLKAMDVACLERVSADLALVAQHPTAQAFNTDLERDIGTRTNRDLEEARRCLAKGDIECADQRMKLPLALRRNDTPVQALQEQLDKARTAVDSAKSCLASSATECAAVPLEGLRQASPQSPLVKGLERRAQSAVPPQEPPPVDSAASAQMPPAVATTATVPQSPVQSPPFAAILVPDIRIGDRWVLQTIDHNNPQWSNSTERLVTEVSSGGMTMTSRNTRSNFTRTLSYTREWNLISERDPAGKGANYSPPIRYLIFPLEKGKTWRAEVRKQRLEGGAEQVYSLSAEVQDIEKVQVGAGTFDTIKVVLQIETRENGVLLFQSTDISWYAPLAKRSVKTEESSNDLQRGVRSNRTIELVDYSVAR